MTVLDDTLVPAALSILSQLGSGAQWTTQGARTYDVNAGSVATTGSIHTVKISPPQLSRDLSTDADSKREERFVSYLAASDLPFIPEVGDRVEWRGNTYQATDVTMLASGDEIAAYAVELQR